MREKGLQSRQILKPGKPWHLPGHHPPQFITEIAVFFLQNLILDLLGDIRDVPGCDQLHAQSHVLWEAQAVRGSQPGSNPFASSLLPLPGCSPRRG